MLNALNLSNIDPRLKEILTLYMIAKWSKDDSCLKFTTFFHYGIPRARLRTPIDAEKVTPSQRSQDSSFNPTSYSMLSTSSISASSNAYDVLPLSPPCSSSSKIDDSFTSYSNSNSFESQRPSVHYYTRNTKAMRMVPKKVKSASTSSINDSKLSFKANESIKIKQPIKIETTTNVVEAIARNDLKMVRGGIVTNKNVYFPSTKQ